MRMKGFLLVGLIILFAVAIVIPLYYFTSSKSKVTTNRIFLSRSTQDGIRPVVTFMLSAQKIYGYTGNDISESKEYDLDEIRSLLEEKKKQVSKDSVFVLIIPYEDATYQTTADVLHEMTVNEIRNYSMREPSGDELAFLKNLTTTNDRY